MSGMNSIGVRASCSDELEGNETEKLNQAIFAIQKALQTRTVKSDDKELLLSGKLSNELNA